MLLAAPANVGLRTSSSRARGTMQTLSSSGQENMATRLEPPAKMPKLDTEVLRVKKMEPDAILPQRGSAGAAGYDLSSYEDTVIPARGKALVSTKLQMALPPSTYGRVAPRSGLAWKNFIDTGAGVIDEDYRGELKVLLFNHSEVDFTVRKGDRIAQLVVERVAYPEVQEVAEGEDLTATQRGAGGFGSTGTGKA